MSGTDVMIFVEDPGAANSVAGLPDEFAAHGHRTRLFAAGFAAEYLRQRGVIAETVPPDATARRLLSDIRPQLVLVGTSENIDTIGLPLIVEARAHSADTVGVVDAPGNSAYRFRGRRSDPLAYAPDWLMVADDRTRREYANLGYPEHRIVVCGHPQFDFVRTEGARLAAEGIGAVRRRLFPRFTGDRPLVVFIAELSSGICDGDYQRTDDYTLSGRGQRDGRTEIVLEEFLDSLSAVEPRPYVVLRLHPKSPPGHLDAFRGEVDEVSAGPPLDTVYAADLVVGMTSMLVCEAAILGKPTLSIVPRASELPSLPGFELDLVPAVTTREALRAELPRLLAGRASVPASQSEGAALERMARFVASRLAGRAVVRPKV